MKPSVEEVLALDLLCLKAPDGVPLDAQSHRVALTTSMPRSEWAQVRRQGVLIAYGYIWPLFEDRWFVGGLAIHPQFRQAPTIAALGSAFAALLGDVGAKRLESHVRRDNRQSLRLHRRLGFFVEQENERAIAFAAETSALFSRLPL